MAQENLVSQFRELIDSCTEAQIDDLLNDPNWGTINFEGCRQEVERTYNMLNQFKVLPIELLPDSVAQNIINTLTPINALLDKIYNFTIERPNPAVERDQLVSQFKSQADQFFSAAHLYIPFLAYQHGDVQRNITELTSSVQQATTLVNNTKEDIKTKKGEIDGIIAAAREATASVGVAHFSADFSQESEMQDKNATHWLWATMAFAGITLVAAICMVQISISPEATTPQIIQLFTSKIIILGLLFTATIWCGRLYKVAKHQYAINRHRANALRTFQAFNKAASDDAARNAVLMETTKSIFAITPSGYLDNDAAPDGGVKIVEIVKQATETAASVK
jgi:hypothetical protein